MNFRDYADYLENRMDVGRLAVMMVFQAPADSLPFSRITPGMRLIAPFVVERQGFS
ncbi:hypothetical protein D9M71_845130 [compost metagenome]